jgi:phosphopentomutase
MKRAFVVVMDACGVGALPDAAEYGDAGTNTLAHLAQEAGGLHLPALERLGLGSILPLLGVPPAPEPVLHGRLHAVGPGKDSMAGHWQLMGVVAPQPPTYPEGFPDDVVALLRETSGHEIICNRTYNGISVIDDFGAQAMHDGSLIVYTSQDSVMQIAAHVDQVPAAELHAICRTVRRELPARHAVGRVIARPFLGEEGTFKRTDGRCDYTLRPPTRSYLEELQAAGFPVHAVGKAGSLFSGIGVDTQHPGANNKVALEQLDELFDTLEEGFVFANLVDTDQVHGHRHDVAGFVGALEEIDAHVARWIGGQRAGDLMILTADHGVDVTAPHTDHTREHVPLLASFPGHGGRRHDGSMPDVGASVLKWLAGVEADGLPGSPFL